MKIAGILAILIGFALTVFTTFSVYSNGRVLDGGDVTVVKNSWYTYSWSPFLGIALIIVGGILIFYAPKVHKTIVTETVVETADEEA